MTALNSTVPMKKNRSIASLNRMFKRSCQDLTPMLRRRLLLSLAKINLPSINKVAMLPHRQTIIANQLIKTMCQLTRLRRCQNIPLKILLKTQAYHFRASQHGWRIDKLQNLQIVRTEFIHAGSFEEALAIFKENERMDDLKKDQIRLEEEEVQDVEKKEE